MKKLPFEVKAGKEYDLILTTLLGIIKPNLMDFEAWMCSHLIDIVYHPHTPNNYMFYLPGFWNNDNNCLRSSYINVGSDVFDGQILDLVSVVNGAIDRGLYVRGHWNSLYIPQSSFYEIGSHAASYLLFGYDEKKRVYFCYGESSSGGCSEFELSFADYEKAVLSRKTDLQLVRVLTGNIEPDLSAFCSEVNKYLIGNNPNSVIYKTGISCWNEFGFVLRYSNEYGLLINGKNLQFLCLSKEMMLNRVRNLGVSDLAVKKAEEVFDLSKEVKSLCQEYNADRKGVNLVIADKYLKEIINCEKSYLSDLLDECRNNT